MIWCVILQCIGVFTFTFVSGALSSILANYDNREAQLQEKLIYLSKLRQQYKISDKLYLEIKKALTYEFKTNLTGIDTFISQLPVHLKSQISNDLHSSIFRKFTLFREIGGRTFTGWIG